MQYQAAIGLETHVQLKTQSKMWCPCVNQYGAPPNTYTCPICLGLPGVLPVANEESLRLTALTGMLLNCKIADYIRFDRKNYFYPDMPKNYQITQLTHPTAQHGYIDIEHNTDTTRIRITRVHLEEDVAKSIHLPHHTGIDYNRAGIPLLEIVTQPDLRNSAMTHNYLNTLIHILTQANISDCDLEKGMLRCDINISLRPTNQTKLGAKIEIKNMNTLNGIRRAINYEIQRQTNALQNNQTLPQETRRWDDPTNTTQPMRTKEDTHDYRYFPDPDLMPFQPDKNWLNTVKQRRIELPLTRKRRLITQYQLPPNDAQTLANNPPLAHYFETIAPQTKHPKTAANWILNNLQAKLTQTQTPIHKTKITPQNLLQLLQLLQDKKINNTTAQQIFDQMFQTGKPPQTILQQKNLTPLTDTQTIQTLCQQTIQQNPRAAADYRAGKKTALNHLKGQIMKQTRGKADPNLIHQTLHQQLTQPPDPNQKTTPPNHPDKN